MRNLVLLIVGIFISSLYACKKSKSESEQTDITYAPFTEPWINKKQKGIDFFALGTEPFWNLEMYSNDKMRFYEFGNADTIIVPAPPLVRNQNENYWSYKSKSNSGMIDVTIREGECNDNMSENKYNYTVEVIARNESERENRRFFGCGSFLNDYRLNDVFALVNFNGNKLNATDYSKGVPYIEMNLPTNKIIGKAGCNSFQGSLKVELNAKEINFGPLASTRMACPNMQMEEEFLKAISSSKVQYSFTKDGLILTSGSNVLEFKKAN